MVDFHCRVIFTCVNKIEAIYERSLIISRFNFYVYARPTIHCLYFINAHKIYVRTHVKITATVENHV